VRQRCAKDIGGCRLARDGETVVHPAAVAPRRDDARPTQVCEMTRDFRLADPEDADEVADADLAIRDEIQEAEARGIRQRAKELVERIVPRLGGHGGEYNTCALTYMFKGG